MVLACSIVILNQANKPRKSKQKRVHEGDQKHSLIPPSRLVPLKRLNMFKPMRGRIMQPPVPLLPTAHTTPNHSRPISHAQPVCGLIPIVYTNAHRIIYCYALTIHAYTTAHRLCVVVHMKTFDATMPPWPCSRVFVL